MQWPMKDLSRTLDVKYAVFFGLAFSFTLLSIFVYMGLVDGIDENLLRFFVDNARVLPSRFTYVLTYSMFLQYAFFPIAMLYLYKKRLHAEIIIYVLMPPTYLIFFGLKQIIARPRPDYYLYMRHGYSYPSGHAALAVVTFIGIYAIYYGKVKGEHDHRVLTLLTSIVVITGLTRLIVGKHYFTDMIAGFLIGGMVVLVYTVNIEHRFIRYLSRWFQEIDERYLSKYASYLITLDDDDT